MAEDEKSPADQLVELLVYAPVGMIYEYENVLEQLVKRGKSQLQLVRLVGKMAAKRGQGELEDNVGEVMSAAALTIAKGITQFGEAVGLAPPTAKDSEPKPSSERKPTTKTASLQKAATAKKAATVKKAATAKKAAQPGKTPPLPIAGYDDLKAKEIVSLLDDLSPAQRKRVRAHELATRARKTVVGKIDRLDG